MFIAYPHTSPIAPYIPISKFLKTRFLVSWTISLPFISSLELIEDSQSLYLSFTCVDLGVFEPVVVYFIKDLEPEVNNFLSAFLKGLLQIRSSKSGSGAWVLQ